MTPDILREQSTRFREVFTKVIPSKKIPPEELFLKSQDNCKLLVSTSNKSLSCVASNRNTGYMCCMCILVSTSQGYGSRDVPEPVDVDDVTFVSQRSCLVNMFTRARLYLVTTVLNSSIESRYVPLTRRDT